MSTHSNALPLIPKEGEFIPSAELRRNRDSKVTKAKNARITEAKWCNLIGLISQGIGTVEAIRQAGVRKHALEGWLRTDEKAKAQWEDAKTTALWRNWDLETIEDIMADIAMGTTVKAAVEKRSFERGNDFLNTFYRLLMRDQFVKEMYDEARMLQAEKMAIDDVLEISDDDSNDTTVDGKGNSANVNRSRLKVQSRQWIAGRMNFKRFGDRKQVDLDAKVTVDHAARLEEARRRKEAINRSK